MRVLEWREREEREWGWERGVNTNTKRESERQRALNEKEEVRKRRTLESPRDWHLPVSFCPRRKIFAFRGGRGERGGW